MQGFRYSLFTLTCALLALVSTPAPAVTLHGLKDSHLDDIYGAYAPRGNCTAEPKITVDDSGIGFTQAGRSTHRDTVEYALTYMGPEYQGISRVIFPFLVSDDDMGRVVMMFNDGEKPGTLKIDPDLGPGQSLTPLQAALVKHSPYAKCRA